MTEAERRMAMCASWPKCLTQQYKKRINRKPYESVDLLDVWDHVLTEHCKVCKTYKPVAARDCKPVSQEARDEYIKEREKQGCATGRCGG